MLRIDIERLERRAYLAITASFVPSGILTVNGDAVDNVIVVSRNAAGAILVNSGAVPISGGTPTVANTNLIQVAALAGNDRVTLDETNGALPRGALVGSLGNDILIGGSGNDTLVGDAGNDTLLGRGGIDDLHGNADNDVLTGGDAEDQVFGDAGDDRLVWNPGDDTDVNEGGDGTDVIEVNGGNGAEAFTATANGVRVRFDRLDPAPFSIDIGTSERVVLNANGGDDQLSATGNLAALIALTIDGGAGNDTLNGSNGIDVFLGGEGNDLVDGNQGNDVAFLGAGDDVFQWDPGDGSDTVEGQDGTDLMLFNGSNIGENISLSAIGGRLRLFRDVANINMDADDVERATVNVLGGADTVTVNSLAGTDVTEVNVNLAALGGAGDAAADNVVVNATDLPDVVTVAGDATGVAVTGLAARVNVTGAEAANDRLTVNALGGNDSVDAVAVPAGAIRLALDGGADNDALGGGAGPDLLLGQAGNDTLQGRGGADVLLGGADNDVLIGGDADDNVSGEAGNDRMVWNPGDDTDVNEGGDGTDVIEVNGGNGAEAFTATANLARVRFDRLDPAPFSIDIGTSETLVLNANGGDDQFSATGSLAALIALTIDGGAGNDTLNGSNGSDVFLGREGNDLVDGNQGNDTAFLGAGDDVFQWDPGDGSDVVEGQDGADTLRFNGSNIAEVFDASAVGGRLRLFRNVGNITMDVNDLEVVVVNAVGGADNVTVNDLAGTDVTEVRVDLAGTLGGTAGDAAADTVVVNGSGGNDNVTVTGAGTNVAVSGLSALVSVSNAEAANDTLTLNALGGDDRVTATTLPANVVRLVVDGGTGADQLHGSQAADLLLGGEGNDFVLGDNGDDTAFLGAGDDVFQWDPGDGSDVVEGQDGVDTLTFFGSNVAENVDVSANAGRARFFRDVANVTMDLDDMERVGFIALGGADAITVADTSGTDVTLVSVDLAGPGGTPDAAEDRVVVNGSASADTISVGSTAGFDAVVRVPAVQVRVDGADAGLDRVEVNAGAGDDTVDASTLAANVVRFSVFGGLGADAFIGSPGDDSLAGGDGNDTALMGAGNDTFAWSPGDDNDTLEGQAGTDTLLFNGSNVGERITLSANGGRLRFFRDVANVVMDANDLERVTFNALGGADTITVDSLAATDVQQVDLNLAGAGGAGDAAADTVLVSGTGGADEVAVTGDTTSALVRGLSAAVSITGVEAGNDRLAITALGGNDTLNASRLVAAIALTLDGGAGDDALAGGPGNDTLVGGDGTNTMDGGAGDDNAVYQGTGRHDDIRVSRRNAPAGPQVVFQNRGAVNASIFLNGEAITVFGGSGNDVIAMDRSAGVLWRAAFFGGSGNDRLIGSALNDTLDGGSGYNVLQGNGGTDTLLSGRIAPSSAIMALLAVRT